MGEGECEHNPGTNPTRGNSFDEVGIVNLGLLPDWPSTLPFNCIEPTKGNDILVGVVFPGDDLATEFK